jgi:glucosylglycerate synthase
VEQVLPDDLRSHLARIGHVDLLVGIPCFQSARTIGHVVTAVEVGLRKFFPDRSAAIVLSDGGSTDGTIDAGLGAGVGDKAELYLVDPASPVPEMLAFRYPGIAGKGSAFRAIFEVAGDLGAVACAVVDADLRSITPLWAERLIAPVLRSGYEFVAPIYVRHRFDGTITNSIAYPLTTALYGTRLRQPIGGEFGLSGELAAEYARRHVWNTDVARFGVDIWMTTLAVVEGHRVCQAALGAKLHDPKDPGKDLGPMFRQVVGSLFALAGQYRSRWAEIRDVVAPPTFGLPSDFTAEPVRVSVDRLLHHFVDGRERHGGLWREVLENDTYGELEQASRVVSDIDITPSLWMEIVCDFLVAYNARNVDAEPLLDALLPLYFARTATFVREVADLTDEEAEAAVDAVADAAIRMKPFLIARWDAAAIPDRSLADQRVPQGEPLEELAPGAV